MRIYMSIVLDDIAKLQELIQLAREADAAEWEPDNRTCERYRQVTDHIEKMLENMYPE